MKICHITFDHFWNDTRVYKKEILTQREEGFDVILFGWDKPKTNIDNGVRFISYFDHQLSKKERMKLMISNSDVVRELIKLNADIYQFHDFTLLEVGRKLKKAGMHVIFDSHENYLGTIPFKLGKNKLGTIVFDKLLDRYYKRVVSSFDAVFTVSPNMVEAIKKYNPKTYMVSNYPSIKNYAEPAKYDKEDFFVFQGTVYGFSNQKYIVEAINKVKSNARYKIIGNVFENEKKIIEDNDTQKRVDIVGWMEKEDLDRNMQQSLGGIVVFDYTPECCFKEGQLGSNKIFEYMLCGLPVICTDFTLWKELIIDKYNCGICVEPQNAEQLKDAMEWIISHPEEAKAMGQRGHDAILNEFNWEKGLRQYFDYYSQIVENTLK